ncbi:hypothetical protein DESC_480265 [Desulfosarcina cetonica]|nr:hypothetical protein DESC_480265 [Desulfosarcina cetonica]
MEGTSTLFGDHDALPVDLDGQSVRRFLQVGGQCHQCPVAEFDHLATHALIHLVRPGKEGMGIQGDGLGGVEQQLDGVRLDHLNDEKGRLRIGEVDLFADGAPYLGDIVAIRVPPDGPVEMVDDAFMLEAAVAVVPTAAIVHPEDGIFLGDYDFGEGVIRG